jgi:prepilin-type N-terminal cleavage/methylation domain-containing protein
MKLSRAGFTIIELLVVLAIIGALCAIILPSFSTFRTRQALLNSRDGVVGYLREARSRTLAGVDNSTYSVRIESNRIVLYKGTVYDPNDVANEYFTFESPTVLGTLALAGGATAISFNHLTGATAQYGTIVLIADTQQSVITIDASGIISQ